MATRLGAFNFGGGFVSGIAGAVSFALAALNWTTTQFGLPVADFAQPLVLIPQSISAALEALRVRAEWAVPWWPISLTTSVILMTPLIARATALFRDQPDEFEQLALGYEPYADESRITIAEEFFVNATVLIIVIAIMAVPILRYIVFIVPIIFIIIMVEPFSKSREHRPEAVKAGYYVWGAIVSALCLLFTNSYFA